MCIRDSTCAAPATETGASRGASVRVVSYNVLSHALARPEQFVACDTADLQEELRWERVKTKIRQEMASGSVICLQEVSRKWAGRLLTEFDREGYTFLTHGYGRSFNDYMGSAIAWPRAKFQTEEAEIMRVSDTTEDWPAVASAQAPKIGMVESAWAWVTGQKLRPPVEPWSLAKNRQNCAILVKLKPKNDPQGGEFCVATYHMPCLFGSDEKCQTMVVHVALLMQHVQRWAQGSAYVVAGDFNLKPHDSTYQLISSGSLPEGHVHLPAGNMKLTLAPMRSAYASVLGAEPEFTNFAKTRNPADPPFCETLDYIWVSPEWKVLSVDQLPTRASLQVESFPSSTEPSDHLLIAAHLQL
eukprot:TRINITY_DN18648_c0_g1_i1.p1 TRINITY_DN18648_c0_g1~~TRINITY_DN18648_c0_g1_i1.p1  ORF type:complete len:357 (-),score=65.68 TRINITY_DN18648_c0_g1_i1:226-1296(-)